jgi:hypothetical protein
VYLGNYVRVHSDIQEEARIDVGFSKITNVAAATEPTDVATYGQIQDYVAVVSFSLEKQIQGLQNTINNLNKFLFNDQIPNIDEENPSVEYNL